MVTEDVRARVTSYIRHQAAKGPPVIRDLVAESQQRLLDVLSGVDDETARKQPAEGEWSVRELMRHVLQSEAGVAWVIQRLSRGEPATPNAGSVQLGRMEDDDESVPFSAYVERLRETNQRLLEVIADLPPEANTEATLGHPFFGELNCFEWAVFQRVHDADHLQHTEKILASL